MRRLNGWLHAGLGVAIGTCLVAGCIPAPNRARLPGTTGQEGIVRTALPPGLAGATNIAGRAPGVPNVVAPPLQAPSVISNNGGNVLKGSVRAPATIISHNGGNIISNNGGGIVSNNGGGIISHNGGNLQIVQMPLAFTTVRVKDAAGQPVKDDQGRELVAKADANGDYSFPVEVKGRNLVIEADVDGQNGKLKSLLPKEGVKAGGSLDVDMTSTLTLAYILDQYVKGDLNTFERLPKDIEAKARVVTEEAIVEKEIALPTTLDDGAIVAKVDEVRRAEPKVDQVFEEIKRLLVIAGIVNEGDGLKSTEVDGGIIGGSTTDAGGNIYVFSHSLHTLWRIAPDGILHTLVPKGAWGYPEVSSPPMTPGYTSGVVREADGSLVIADTYYNRVVRVSPFNQVTVIAGTGVAGFGGDGGESQAAKLNRPSGLVIDAAGNIIVSDTENHRVRKISKEGQISTILGDGTAGYSGDGGPSIMAKVNRPQGLALGPNQNLYVADYENGRVRAIAGNGLVQTLAPTAALIHSPIAIAIDDGPGVLCLSHWAAEIYRLTATDREIVLGQSTPIDGFVGSLAFPRSLTTQGTKKILDTGTNVFGSLNEDGSFTRLLGSWTPATSANREKAQFIRAFQMVVDKDENIYITDMAAQRIVKVRSNGDIEAVVGNGMAARAPGDSAPLQAGVGMVAGIALANDGQLLFTSIGKFTALWKCVIGESVTVIAGTGKVNYTKPPLGFAAEVELPNSYDVVQLPDGTIVFSVSDHNYLLSLSTDGTIDHLVSPQKLGRPDCLAVNTQGDLAFVEKNSGQIFLRTGGVTSIWLRESDLGADMPIGDIRALAFDTEGNLYMAGANRVKRYGVDKRLDAVAGVGAPYLNGSTRDQGLEEICDIAVSAAGHLYILEPQQLKRVASEDLKRL